MIPPPAGSSLVSVGDPPEMMRIGKYQVLRRFSEETGQGDAYQAVDPDLGRHVVLKRYRGEPGEVEEGRALARVRSRYVADCHGVEWVDDEAFLVVEYVPGRNLSELRRDGPVDLERAVLIVRQLAEGVAAVHACGLIHRDIKLENVILHLDGTPRLVDFGLACHLGSDRLRGRCGSPRYMAPEQARGESNRIDYRADVYGLGGVLYELITGERPHQGASLGEVLEQAENGEVRPAREIDPAIPVPLEAVCMRALAAVPEDRYSTAADFADTLGKVILSAPARSPKSRGLLAGSRWARPGAIVACGLAILGVVSLPRYSGPSSSVTPGISAAPVSAALAHEVAVDHFRELGDGRRVVPLESLTTKTVAEAPPRLDDLVRVRVTFNQPAYAYLIALNPDGKDQLCLPGDWHASPSPRSELEFPPDPSDYFGLTDGDGLQAFVIVASEHPLPDYAAWRAQVPGGLVWSRMNDLGLSVYDSADGNHQPSSSGLVRGEIRRRDGGGAAFVRLCDRLRCVPDVTLVRAVAFPVKAAGEKVHK